MRTPVLVAALLALSAAPLAAAHADHAPCPIGSETLAAGVVHVDEWSVGCIGLGVGTDVVSGCRGAHQHFSGFHVFVLYGESCLSGVILENLEAHDAATPLLP